MTTQGPGKWHKAAAVVIFLLNMEVLVIPFLKNQLGLTGFPLWSASVLWATADFIFWYWFIGRVMWGFIKSPEVIQALSEGKELSQQVRDELEKAYRKVKESSHLDQDEPEPGEMNLLEQVTMFVLTYLNPNQFRNKSVMTAAQVAGYVVIFLMGCVFPFFVGIFICRVLNWMKGFVVLSIGNVVKITLFVVGYHLVPPWVGTAAIVSYCLLILWALVYRRLRLRRKNRQ